MSIIYDALNKMDKAGNGGQGGAENEKKGPGKKKKFPVTFLLGVLVIGLAIFVAKNYTFKEGVEKFAGKFNKKNNVVLSRPAIAKTAAPAHSEPQPKQYSSNKYILEGIIYDNETPTAIINGQVLRSKEKIDDYEVVDITSSSVSLRNVNSNATQALSF